MHVLLECEGVDREDLYRYPETDTIRSANRNMDDRIVEESNDKGEDEEEMIKGPDNKEAPLDGEEVLSYWLSLKRTPQERAYFGNWAERAWREWEELVTGAAPPVTLRPTKFGGRAKGSAKSKKSTKAEKKVSKKKKKGLEPHDSLVEVGGEEELGGTPPSETLSDDEAGTSQSPRLPDVKTPRQDAKKKTVRVDRVVLPVVHPHPTRVGGVAN